MYASGEHHAQRCLRIIGRHREDETTALVMIPQLERPRTLESVRRQNCFPKLTEKDDYWHSIKSLNIMEQIALESLGERFFFGNVFFELAVRNFDYEERQARAIKKIQRRFNVEMRPLNKYSPKDLYLFEQIICFGEDMGSCVPVLSDALRQISVHTSP